MKKLGKLVHRVLGYIEDRTGVSTVEYALVVVAVVAIVGGGMALLGGSFKDLFTELGTQIDSQTTNLKKLGTT